MLTRIPRISAAVLAAGLSLAGCAGEGFSAAAPGGGDGCPPVADTASYAPVSGQVSPPAGPFRLDVDVCLDADMWTRDGGGDDWIEFECLPQMRISAAVSDDGSWTGELAETGCRVPLPGPLLGYGWGDPAHEIGALAETLTAGAARTADSGGELLGRRGERAGLKELPPAPGGGRGWEAEIGTDDAKELFGVWSWWLDVSEDTQAAELLLYTLGTVIEADASGRPANARFSLVLPAGYSLGAVWESGPGPRFGGSRLEASGGYDLYSFTVTARWDWSPPQRGPGR